MRERHLDDERAVALFTELFGEFEQGGRDALFGRVRTQFLDCVVQFAQSRGHNAECSKSDSRIPPEHFLKIGGGQRQDTAVSMRDGGLGILFAAERGHGAEEIAGSNDLDDNVSAGRGRAHELDLSGRGDIEVSRAVARNGNRLARLKRFFAAKAADLLNVFFDKFAEERSRAEHLQPPR
jgi:hypothetical protein